MTSYTDRSSASACGFMSQWWIEGYDVGAT